MKKNQFALGLALATLASTAFAADAGWDTISQVKAFTTHIDVVLATARHACGSGSSDHFKIAPTNTNLIRLAEAAWLSGKEVNLNYSCGTIDGGTNAVVAAVRAR